MKYVTVLKIHIFSQTKHGLSSYSYPTIAGVQYNGADISEVRTIIMNFFIQTQRRERGICLAPTVTYSLLPTKKMQLRNLC